MLSKVSCVRLTQICHAVIEILRCISFQGTRSDAALSCWWQAAGGGSHTQLHFSSHRRRKQASFRGRIQRICTYAHRLFTSNPVFSSWSEDFLFVWLEILHFWLLKCNLKLFADAASSIRLIYSSVMKLMVSCIPAERVNVSCLK